MIMYIPTTFDDATLTFICIIIVIIITLAITRFVAFSMNKMERFQDDMTATYLIRDIITYIIYFIALMVILQFFGINVAGTLLSVGIVGIAVSFAAKDIISNLFSGIILIIGKSVKVGQTIEINNQKGYVERIFLRSTVIVNDLGVRINETTPAKRNCFRRCVRKNLLHLNLYFLRLIYVIMGKPGKKRSVHLRDTQIKSGGNAAVGLAEISDSIAIGQSDFFCKSTIRGTVIYHKHFNIWICLSKGTVDGFL